MSTPRRTGTIRTILTAAVAAMLTATGDAGAADASGPALEEIVVTAQKRTESLQDVPLSITAFDEGFVDRVGILDAKSVISFSPSLAGNQKSSFTDTLTMRGIGSTNFGVGSEPALGIYKDNIYQGRSGSSIASLFDVERIEVLRGPQSFLFGRHATAGAVHVITNKPAPDRVEGYLTLGYGERDHLDAEGALNVPLGESSAARLSGALRQEDGYITNIFPGTTEKVIDYDHAAVRGELARDGEKLDVLFAAEYEDREDTATIYSALDETGRELTGDSRTIDSEFGSDHPDHGRIVGASLQLDYDGGFATLTSITGYRGHDWEYAEDSDGLGIRISNYLQNQDGDYWSQEFRLVSSGESWLEWYVGVSAYGEDIDADYGLAGDEDVLCGLFFIGDPSVGCEEAWPLVFGVPFPTTPGLLLEQGFVEGDYDGWAAYADVTYSLTERLDVNVGLRYSKDNKDFTMFIPLADSPLAPVFIGYFTPEPISDDKSWDDLSPRITLTFRPSDEWMLYASATKGYKAGGFDMFTAVAPNGENFIGGPTPPGSAPNSFGPEEIWSYEAGLKATLFDARTQLALSAFHYRYTDLQFAAAEELGQLAVRNVGQVDGDGVELEVRARPVQPLELYVSTAYIDTSVEDVPEATCGLPSCDGNRMPYQSKWKAVAGAAVMFPLDVLGGTEIFGSADVQYQDAWFGEISNLPITEENDYTVLNLRGGVRSADQRWEAAAYLDNATDEDWYDGRILLFTGPTAFGPSRPRTFGGTVTYRFGLE